MSDNTVPDAPQNASQEAFAPPEGEPVAPTLPAEPQEPHYTAQPAPEYAPPTQPQYAAQQGQASQPGPQYTYTNQQQQPSPQYPPQQPYGYQQQQQVPPQQPYGYQQAYVNPADVKTTDKDRLVAGLLAIFLGSLGIHKFYLGYSTEGLIMLLVTVIGACLTLGIGSAVMAIIALIEGIMYLVKSQQEFERIYVYNKKGWF
jgi:TM2 domain-containing membrane protein YozV